MDGLGALDAEIGLVSSLLAGTDAAGLRRPVRSCPGWDVAEVVRHLGGVHRWATAIVDTGRDGSVDAVAVAARAPDRGHPADLRDWFAEGAHQLRAAVGAAPADRPCWTLAGSGTASFWVRRQALETAVHRVDVGQALGDGHELELGLAIDGIDEVVTVMAPRQVRLRRTGPRPGRLTLVAIDAGLSWQIGHHGPPAVLRGPAAYLCLVLWGRLDLGGTGVEVTGDRTVLAAALAPGALTP